MPVASPHRRALVRSFATGGLLAAVARPSPAAAAGWQPGLLRADALEPGDIVGGPDSSAFRVHAVARRRGRVHLQYTDPQNVDVPLTPSDDRGSAPSQPFLVYARRVPSATLGLGAGAGGMGRTVDGGRP
jgi:hypothetical protein